MEAINTPWQVAEKSQEDSLPVKERRFSAA
jgi:hypothetical protein